MKAADRLSLQAASFVFRQVQQVEALLPPDHVSCIHSVCARCISVSTFRREPRHKLYGFLPGSSSPLGACPGPAPKYNRCAANAVGFSRFRFLWATRPATHALWCSRMMPATTTMPEVRCLARNSDISQFPRSLPETWTAMHGLLSRSSRRSCVDAAQRGTSRDPATGRPSRIYTCAGTLYVQYNPHNRYR